MITEGPFALTAGTPLALSDPGVGGGMAKVQIQNQSGFTLKVVNGTTVSTIQSYWVQTISLVPGGTGITILPAADGTAVGTNALTVVWLLSYESPPMTDGALSAADIAIASGNVTATIDGPVTVETAAGTAIEVAGSLTSIADPVSVSGTIDVQGVAGGTTVGVAGTVDANITNATVTVETTGTSDVNVTNATIPVSGSVDATIDGPVALSGGTIYVVNPFTGETLPSAAGSTTTGNATLSATDYNLVTWDAVPLPAGSPGNLVYDSNLTNAIAAVGPTWTVTATIGTAAGDMNVLNGGADSAEWAFYGTGAAMYQHAATQVIAVIPGSTYTLAGNIDASAVTSGLARLMIYDPTGTTEYGEVDQTVGVAGEVSAQITIPAGVDQVIVFADVATMVAPSGSLVTFSQIQLTETSTVQPYEPGPLWTYPVYGRGGYLGETTALAYEDTGAPVDTTRQPPGINSSYPQLPAPGAPTVTVEGTTGSTTYAYQVTAQSPNASAGTTRLAPNPGANIGTMDIAAGAKVEIAAGSAQIGTVDLAAGATVDATIQNATLDVTGSTINVASGTSVHVAPLSGLPSVPTNQTISTSAFGTGSDGAVTISADTTLTRDMQYTTLVVESGVTLSSAGWTIRATESVTVDGTIDNSASGHTPGATGSSGGGGAGISASGTGTTPPSADLEGGAGGSTDTNAGGATSPLPAIYTSILANGGTLSGGGGGANYGSTGYYSGGGGGVVVILTPSLLGSGTISANGGDSQIAPSDELGGGGGGVILITSGVATTPMLSVTGGTGTGGAANGNDGNILVI